MAIQVVVEDINTVDEKYRDLYSEKNGKWELTEVAGIRTEADVTRLQSALNKERADHKKAKETLQKFDGLDPEEVRTKLDRVVELEELVKGKPDDNKINEIVEQRLKSRIAPLEREKTTLATKLAEKEKAIEELTHRERRSKIVEEIRSAATKAKLLPEAIDDAVLLGMQTMDLDEMGAVRVKANSGFTEGVDPSVWFTELQNKRPHWWGTSSGSGARGSGGSNSGENPFSHEHWNLTKQGQLMKENPKRAEEMARSAGTTIGGKRPPAKK